MQRPFLIHALSPLHAGTGQSAGVIDLPIARMAATGIPFAPGSGIKGVLRDARRQDPNKAGINDWDERCKAVFGPDTSNAADHAGALVVGDARLLALPVRSFKGAFVWVTSPLLLTLAKRDLGKPFEHLAIPEIEPERRRAILTRDNICLVPNSPANQDEGILYLQDLDLPAQRTDGLLKWSELLAPLVSGGDTKAFSRRFAVIDDDTMAFLWETATQVDQRIRIHEETRTVVEGALWSEESLPHETLLIGQLEASRSRRPGKDDMQPRAVLDLALPSGEGCILQFGGKATVGRGRCRMVAIK